jgi:16S rRNA (guanine527-N7)-methyltransferase
LRPQILERHVEDALALLPVIADAVGPDSESAALRLVDVGSGAGFPGMVLAIARPRWKITLVDSMAKVRTRCGASMPCIVRMRAL